MASFKVGDKAKRVSHPGFNANETTMPIGATGTVISVSNGMVGVAPDSGLEAWYCIPETLAPLLNPGTERDAAAERFIEKLKQLGREPVTLTEKQLSSVFGGGPSGCAPIVGRGGK